MNGNSTGIVPTIDLATNNGAYPYPIMYGNSGFGGNGFLGGDGWIVLLLLLAFGGNWGNNGNGGFFGGGSFDNGYAWLSNGQKEIMQNTNQAVDALHLSNQIEGVRDSLNGISSQMCNSTYTLNDSIKDGFYGLNTSFLNCCCENRLATQDLKATVISENCSDREVLREIGQSILVNQTANTQKIIDEIFRDRLDEKDDKIAELNRQILMKDLQASQIAQTATLREGQEREVDALYNRLATCPVGTTPVYGRTPIFTCNNNSGCGCNTNFANGLF